MKTIAALIIIFLFSALPVFASSQQAYQDYLFQFNLFRQKDTEFQTAKSEYKKFQTLTSQTTAIAASRSMMSQRDLLYRSYLLYLRENLLENTGLPIGTRDRYLGLVNEDLGFFENHYLSILSVATIEGATAISTQLEERLLPLNTHMYKTISILALGKLMAFGKYFDLYIEATQTLVGTHTDELSEEKRAIINQWFSQITQKRQAFAQAVETIQSTIEQTGANDAGSLEQQYGDISDSIQQARMPLSDGVGYLQELVAVVKYKD